jgi:hypothetical protein
MALIMRVLLFIFVPPGAYSIPIVGITISVINIRIILVKAQDNAITASTALGIALQMSLIIFQAAYFGFYLPLKSRIIKLEHARDDLFKIVQGLMKLSDLADKKIERIHKRPKQRKGLID